MRAVIEFSLSDEGRRNALRNGDTTSPFGKHRLEQEVDPVDFADFDLFHLREHGWLYQHVLDPLSAWPTWGELVQILYRAQARALNLKDGESYSVHPPYDGFGAVVWVVPPKPATRTPVAASFPYVGVVGKAADAFAARAVEEIDE